VIFGENQFLQTSFPISPYNSVVMSRKSESALNVSLISSLHTV
jgi:hypothetical protein